MKESSSKFIKKIFIGSIIVIVIVSCSALVVKTIKDKQVNKVTQKDITAPKIVPVEVVTGSGTIKSSNKFEVTPIVTGKVKKVCFKEGDSVKAKDLMFEIDSSAADENVNKLTNAIEQAKLEQNNNLLRISKLIVIAPASGQVSNVLVKKGAIILKGTPIVTIVDRSKLKLTVPFNSEQIKNITVGVKATVCLNATGQFVTGIVSYISPNSHPADKSSIVFNVEILIDNPGAVKSEQKASVEIDGINGPISSPEEGLLSYVDTQVVSCDSDGKVDTIDLKEDQFIKAGTVLMTLTNEAVVAEKAALELKIKDLQSQLDYAKKQLEDYKIYSPMDGTILKQDIKVGEIPKNGEPISNLSDLAHMELVVAIDDIDITKIKLGQKGSIKIDALPETLTKPLEISVSKIAVEGNIVNGTTTYPVTFAINNASEVKSGMNANVEIKIVK